MFRNNYDFFEKIKCLDALTNRNNFKIGIMRLYAQSLLWMFKVLEEFEKLA
jgi:hypothetical protein